MGNPKNIVHTKAKTYLDIVQGGHFIESHIIITDILQVTLWELEISE